MPRYVRVLCIEHRAALRSVVRLPRRYFWSLLWHIGSLDLWVQGWCLALFNTRAVVILLQFQYSGGIFVDPALHHCGYVFVLLLRGISLFDVLSIRCGT